MRLGSNDPAPRFHGRHVLVDTLRDGLERGESLPARPTLPATPQAHFVLRVTPEKCRYHPVEMARVREVGRSTVDRALSVAVRSCAYVSHGDISRGDEQKKKRHFSAERHVNQGICTNHDDYFDRMNAGSRVDA